MNDRDPATAESAPPGGPRDVLDRLFRSGRTNALLGWATLGVLVVAVGESALDADLQWVALSLAFGVVAVVPPVAHREWQVMLPWELLALTLVPVLVRAVVGGHVGTFATYLAVACVALLVTVELHMFSDLEVTHWFAVASVVLTTLASVAAWTVARWGMDRYLGTGYLTTNEALMSEWLAVLLAGLAAGVLFDVYFRWRDDQLREEIQRSVGR